jgi:hypothetical protein
MRSTHSSHDLALRRTVIEPANGWKMLDVRGLWAYCELLWALTPSRSPKAYGMLKRYLLKLHWLRVTEEAL